ncbi:MAG: hypothetical protein WA880_00145 [Ornithinimicrobium sp.]
MRFKAAWAVGILITAGCSSGEEAEVASLPCEQSIFTDQDVPQDYEILLDAVALPTSQSSPEALQASLRREADDEPGYFAKTGLVVRSGAVFDLIVDSDADVAMIGWGAPADFSTMISSQGCDGEGWIAFAGGFVVTEPMCVDLTLRSGDEEQTFSVGAGSACEGQIPPPTQ